MIYAYKQTDEQRGVDMGLTAKMLIWSETHTGMNHKATLCECSIFRSGNYSPDNRTPFFRSVTTKIYNSVESELLNSNFPSPISFFADMHDPAKNVAAQK